MTEELKKMAQGYFDRDETRKGMFATESGHFFYEKDARNQFIQKAEKLEKPVDFFRPKKVEVEIKHLIPEGCPFVGVLTDAGMKTVEDVKSYEGLSKLPGIGPGKATKIKDFLKINN